MSAGVRALLPREWEAFRVFRVVAGELMPYFLHALFALSPVAAPGLGTFAVDRHWRLYMDPEVLVGPDAWTPAEGGAVLLHEVGHLLRDHAGRAELLPFPRSHEAFNLAGDAEINDDLVAAGAPLPAGVITPAVLGQPDGLLAEQYYAALIRQASAAPDFLAGLDDGGSGCGSGSGTVPLGVELPAPGMADGGKSPGPPGDLGGLSDAAAGMVRRAVAAAVQAHADGKGRGSVPAGLSRWAADTLAPPTVPWARVLRAAVRRAVSAAAGRSDYTYSRPSRRRVRGVVTPAMRGPAVAVSIVVDTSGSMSSADLDAAMGEVRGVLGSSGVNREHLRVLSCDAATGTAQRVRTVGGIELRGGGGTDMRVGIAAAESGRPAPHVVIVLTDGFTPWPASPTRARLICGLIGSDAGRAPETPPWATTVRIPHAARPEGSTR